MTLDENALRTIFTGAFTHYEWRPQPVPRELLGRIYELARLGPTSANCCPLRIAWLDSPAAKTRLRPALSSGNVDKAMSAPVVAILATDTSYLDRLPDLFPAYDARSWFTATAPSEAEHGLRNATLQAAYVIVAARALGLDCGPMSGFDPRIVNETFFGDRPWQANFLLNLGYGAKIDGFTRKPRLDVAEACVFL